MEATLLDLPETVDFVGEEYGLDRVEGLRTVGADFLEDHRSWFQEVGFGDLEIRDLDADRQLVTAVRDSEA